MSKSVKVVVDADAIIASTNPGDSNYNKAVKTLNYLNSSGAVILYPVTAVAEAATVLQTKMNSLATAFGAAHVFTNPNYQIVEINQGIYDKAVNDYFSKVTNKNDTLFDCIVASVADKYEADYIFSFDKFYTRLGFKLASEK